MNSKEEQVNSEASDLAYESSREEKKDSNYISEQTLENKLVEKQEDIEDKYKFGWSSYSEITNGRFAMVGFVAIIIIELFSQQSFLKWAGIL